MKEIRLLKAIGAADEELMVAYEQDSGEPKRAAAAQWVRWGAVAACLCLVAAGVLAGPRLSHEPGLVDAPIGSVTAPPSQSSHGNGGGKEGPRWKTAVVYNEVSALTAAARAYIPGYFTEELSAQELAAIVPGKRLDWMAYSGHAGFNGEGALLEVSLDVSTTLAGTSVTVTMGENVLPRDYSLPVEPVASVNGRVEFMVYQYDAGSYLLLEADSELDGVKYHFHMSTTAELLDRAKADFEAILDCFTHYDSGLGTPDLAAVRADGIPRWRDERLTEQAARLDPDFGAFLPQRIPAGFAEESIRRFMGQNENRLSGLWTRGYDSLSWSISYLDDNARARLTAAVDTENYDLALYPIPRADSVPRALREIVDNPVFRIDELTQEVVNARAYRSGEVGDSDGYRMRFSVLYGDVVVEVSSKGVAPEWVLAQLMGLYSSQ